MSVPLLTISLLISSAEVISVELILSVQVEHHFEFAILMIV